MKYSDVVALIEKEVDEHHIEEGIKQYMQYSMLDEYACTISKSVVDILYESAYDEMHSYGYEDILSASTKHLRLVATLIDEIKYN